MIKLLRVQLLLAMALAVFTAVTPFQSNQPNQPQDGALLFSADDPPPDQGGDPLPLCPPICNPGELRNPPPCVLCAGCPGCIGFTAIEIKQEIGLPRALFRRGPAGL